ncbi:hypothetical protein MLD38_011342 [Melastoma candidum]|uniref:Uncharacterized protein n=1 Tax=Melastoma candidum TaxID=119954 RepID=A0ACB9R258_9MYRT|nr:hypothetical protein MLD38_011342 [Melastoma candidum]
MNKVTTLLSMMSSSSPNRRQQSHGMIVVVAGLLLCTAVKTSAAEFPQFQLPQKEDGSVDFLVVGDWGRGGDFNQSKVAEQMGIVGDQMGIQFVISTGDNFYEDGLTGTCDPNFTNSFTNIYTAPSLNKPWYNVLGNHDYRGDAEAQLSPILKAKDGRWNCFRSAILSAGPVDFIFVDTTPFVDTYFKNPGEHRYDWTGVLPRETYLSDMLKELDWTLKASSGPWKIVVGHHPIKTAGEHGVTEELVQRMLPILKINNVDFYINGHDHCLQRIASIDSKLEFLTSGGGSKAWRGIIRPLDKPQEMKFYYDGQGFLAVRMHHYKASFHFYDVYGNNLHNWDVQKIPFINT